MGHCRYHGQKQDFFVNKVLCHIQELQQQQNKFTEQSMMFLTLICLHIGPWHWHHKTKTSSI